ncbi:MAG TPA: ATP-binding cassette domain-containing protein, partial [Mesotoga sp.]|nr:ATP-binding cassette domain-containing protein [Mesotoga sp.]
MEDFPVLEMKHISKSFPGVMANDDISLQLKKGEVHALLGENGAGKTTLMNILFGIYHADRGEVFINNGKVSITSPSHALKYGIGMVQQHFTLVPSFMVVRNLGLLNT